MSDRTHELLAMLFPGFSLEETPRNIVQSFGDGYKQVIPNGMAGIDRTLNLSWENMTPADGLILVTFFRSSFGQPVSFIAGRDRSPRRWLLKSWRRSYPDPTLQTITAVFEERVRAPA